MCLKKGFCKIALPLPDSLHLDIRYLQHSIICLSYFFDIWYGTTWGLASIETGWVGNWYEKSADSSYVTWFLKGKFGHGLVRKEARLTRLLGGNICIFYRTCFWTAKLVPLLKIIGNQYRSTIIATQAWFCSIVIVNNCSILLMLSGLILIGSGSKNSFVDFWEGETMIHTLQDLYIFGFGRTCWT